MTSNTEAVVDPSLPDLPTGYQLRRCVDGALAGRIFLTPTDATASWSVDTPRARLLLVWESWSRYADARNGADRTL